MASRSAAEPPDGFVYQPDFVTTEEERTLLESVREMPFAQIHFRGVTAKRRVVHLGWLYDYDTHALTPGPPVPEPLQPVLRRAAELADVEAARFEEVLVTEYTPGATIGWHRDAPMFGARVVGVSLLGGCRFRLRRRRDDAWEVYEQWLEPRSAYVLGGAARSAWQHSIPPTRELRYSITLRTLRRRPPAATAGAGAGVGAASRPR